MTIFFCYFSFGTFMICRSWNDHDHETDFSQFLEWQKSESLKKFWWDFLTCLLEQTALRGLNSPASFWLLSFSFVNISLVFVWSFHDLSIGGAISSPIAIEGAVFTGFCFCFGFLAQPSLYNFDTFSSNFFWPLWRKYQSLTFDYHFESMPGPLDWL